MDDTIQWFAAITLGTFSLPLALGLGWLSLRCIFDFMPHKSNAAARPAIVASRHTGRAQPSHRAA